MSKPDLEEVFNKLLSAGQAFVFFRLPNQKTVHCHFQEDASLTLTDDLKIKGFLMSRFFSPLPAAYIYNKNHLKFEYQGTEKCSILNNTYPANSYFNSHSRFKMTKSMYL